MAMFYAPSFDCSDLNNGFGIVRFSASGESNFDVDVSALVGTDSAGVATPVLNHLLGHITFAGHDYRRSNALGGSAGRTFAAECLVAMRAAAAVAGWDNPTTLTLAFSPSSSPPRYTFGYPSDAFTAIQFLSTATRELFGFSGNFSGSAASVSGTVTPSHIIVPTVDGASNVSVDYEPDEVSSQAFSASGVTYGMSRYSSQIWRDWTQQYESKEKTWREFAEASHPYTFQRMFEEGRGYPFGVYDGFGNSQFPSEAFFLREPWFEARRAVDGTDDHWHIPLKCVGAGAPGAGIG